MELVKAQLARVQQQLAGLSASQKMLTVTLVAVMVGTLVWWAKYAGAPAMEPLLNQPMSGEEVASIKTGLDRRNIKSEIQGDKIYIPVESKWDALAVLSEDRLLPSDTKTGFDEIVKSMSPWDTAAKQTKMWNEAKQRTLAKVIRRYEGVADATVLIDIPEQRSFTNPAQPTATVNITMRRGRRGSPKLAAAAADFICGAQAGLRRSNVAVIIDATPVQLADRDGDAYVGSGEIIENRRNAEKMFEDKIRQQLSFIPQIMVSVTVELDLKTRTEQSHTVDPKNTVQKAISESNQSSESSSGGQAQGEAGAVPNTGLSLTGAGGGGGVNETKTEKNEYKVDISSTDSVTKIPAGGFHATAATVRVPRSWFVGVYKAQTPSAKDKDPDEASLQPIIAAELEHIRNDVKKCTGLTTEDAVAVQPYTDMGPAFATGAGEEELAGASSGAGAVVSGHAKEIAIGALAVVSMFMVTMMVRKSAPVPIVMPEAESNEPERFGGELIAGEAGSGEPLLDGMELDDESVKTQQMLDQVSVMVKENPDAAATLVKRWLNRS